MSDTRGSVPFSGAPSRAARMSRAATATLFAVPMMLLAHLVTAHAAPRPSVAVLVAGTVFGLTAATGTRSRWRLAAVVGLAQFAGHAVLAVLHPAAGPASAGGCLPMVGRGAELGLRLALLRQDSSCPPGSVSAGPATTAALAGLLTAGLILLTHSVLAVVTALLVTAGELAVRTVRACAVLTVPRAVPARVPVTAAPPLPPPAARHRPIRTRFVPAPSRRRGPPATVTA